MCATNPSNDALSDYQKLRRADYGAGAQPRSDNPPGTSGHSFHSYSFYVSSESSDVEMPMAYATTGGLLEYAH